jgi:hypothetical protein
MGVMEDDYRLLSTINYQIVSMRRRIGALRAEIAATDSEGLLLSDLVDALLLWERSLRAYLAVRASMLRELSQRYPMVKDDAGTTNRLCGCAASSAEHASGGRSDTVRDDAGTG